MREYFVCAKCGERRCADLFAGKMNVRSGGIMTQSGNRYTCRICEEKGVPERHALRTSKNSWNIKYTFGVVPERHAEMLDSVKYQLVKGGKMHYSTAEDSSLSGVKRMAYSLREDTGIKCWAWEVGFQFPIPQKAEAFSLFGMEDVEVYINTVSWVTHNKSVDEIIWQVEAIKEFAKRFQKTGNAEKAYVWTVERFESYSSEAQRRSRCSKYEHLDQLWRK